MSEEQKQSKFPSELVDLPSEGKVYPKDSPLSSGKIELKYMTAREEDILTSINLVKKGVVVEKLLNSLILTPGVRVEDLITGDKNGIMVAARILAYGPEYTCELDTQTGKTEHTFNLADCPFKDLPADVDYSTNEFDLELPVSKKQIKFKILTGNDELRIEKELEQRKKLGAAQSYEITTRLKHVIVSVDGNSDKQFINSFVDNLLARDSIAIREELSRISPDVEMKQTIDIGEGEQVVDIPLTVNFLWPSAER